MLAGLRSTGSLFGRQGAEKLVDLCDYGSPFANRGGDPFGRAGANISNCKYAVDAGLQWKRPSHARSDIGAR
jgi:hypothetical protein